MTTEPAQLSDEDLLDRAHQLRLLALRGTPKHAAPPTSMSEKFGAALEAARPSGPL